MAMSTSIIIDSYTEQNFPHIDTGNLLPPYQVGGVALGCARLLNNIGDLEKMIELIKVKPCHAFKMETVFVFKIIVKPIEGEKIVIEHTLDLNKWPVDVGKESAELAAAVASELGKCLCAGVQMEMKRRIVSAENTLSYLPEQK